MMLANLVCSLIKHKRVTTTLAKAKAARSVADKMVTLGKQGSVHARRLASARLHQNGRSQFESKAAREKYRQNDDVVHILFDEIAPVFKERRGGYTRILKIGGKRQGDAAEMAILEWTELPVSAAPAAPTEAPGAEAAEGGETKAKAKKGSKKKKEAAGSETAKA